MKTKNYFMFLAIISILGILISGYLTYDHYNDTGFCLSTEEDSCSKVTQSEYSHIFSIPIALFGLVAYLLIFIFSIMHLSGNIKKSRRLFNIFIVYAFLALGYSIFLFYISLFVFGTICMFCFSLYVLNFLIFLATIFKIKHYRKYRTF